MPTIAGMTIGSWILLAVIIAWAFIAIKVQFLGGFKKKDGSKSKGSCCDLPDEAFKVTSACSSCSKRNGCATLATSRNAVAPIIKQES